MKKFLFAFFVFLIISPTLLSAQTTCANYATLTITSSKTTYRVGEPFSGEIVFNNNIGPAKANLTVTVKKDDSVMLTNTVHVSAGNNAWTLRDALGANALGADTLPEPGTYLISLAASHQDSDCLWSAALTLTVTTLPLFVPDKFVPLSLFLRKENINQETLTFQVKPDILQYLTSNSYRISIARNTGSAPSGIEYLLPTYIDTDGGRVTLNTSKPGVFVVASDAFLNDFPIVTHWDQSLNGGRGGPRLGAVDPLAVLDFDVFTNQITGGGLDIRDYDPSNPYQYATDKLALFSGDRQNPNARVPSYERYIGEDYTRSKITDLLAVYISDQVLRNTGYPIVNKNYVSLNPTGALQQNIPVFQVLHHYLIAAEPDKASLATFILPPRWGRQPIKPYPILFNGAYDVPTSYVSDYGIPTAKIINDLMAEGFGSSIVILWNSGGARTARALQRSVYDNAALLFYIAQQKFGADPHKVVAFGLSRGGLTALLLASDPYHNNYTVKYALAYNSPVKAGEHINDFANPSFPSMLEVISSNTGYKYAWMLNWENLDTGWSGRQTLLYNLLGTIDPDEADNRSPFSDQHIDALKRKGTKVLLYQATHDSFMPFSLTLKYVDKLALAGIPLRFEIAYRFGHSPPATNCWEYAKIALQRVLTGDETFQSGTFHYKRKSETEIEIPVQFTPAYQPVFLQAPKAGYWGETLSFTIIGGKGTQYYLKVHKIDDALWENQRQIQKLSQNNYLSFGGTLENTGSPIKSRARHVLIANNSVPAGYYLYELFYSIDGGNTWLQVVPEGIPQPYGDEQPVLQIGTEEPLANGVDIAAQLGTASRTWGLSSDAGSVFAPSPLPDTSSLHAHSR